MEFFRRTLTFGTIRYAPAEFPDSTLSSWQIEETRKHACIFCKYTRAGVCAKRAKPMCSCVHARMLLMREKFEAREARARICSNFHECKTYTEGE